MIFEADEKMVGSLAALRARLAVKDRGEVIQYAVRILKEMDDLNMDQVSTIALGDRVFELQRIK